MSDVLEDTSRRAQGRAASAARMPRLGFVGAGWIGRNRLDAIAASGIAEIAAVTDPAAEVAAKVVETYPAACHVETFEALLQLDLDGVVIATPSALHAPQCISALEQGLAVFCQKPLARTHAETQAVVDCARRADRLLGVDLSYRFTAGMQAIRDVVRAGQLGTVYAVEATFHNAYGPDKAWFYDRGLSGGGCLLDLGIHLVDLALWTLDWPSVLAARGVLRKHENAATGFRVEVGVEDYASGQLELETGATVQLACSWRVAAGCDARIELTFFGTRGGACFRNVDGSFYDFVAEQFLPDRTRHMLAWPPDAWGGRAAVAWVEQLTRSPKYDSVVEHVSSVAAALDALYGTSSGDPQTRH